MKALYKVTYKDDYKKMAEIMDTEFHKTVWFVQGAHLEEYFEPNSFIEDMKCFKDHRVPFEELPEDVKEEIKDTLNFFDQACVRFELGEFHVAAGCGIRASYPFDFYGLETYRKADIA